MQSQLYQTRHSTHGLTHDTSLHAQDHMCGHMVARSMLDGVWVCFCPCRQRAVMKSGANDKDVNKITAFGVECSHAYFCVGFEAWLCTCRCMCACFCVCGDGTGLTTAVMMSDTMSGPSMLVARASPAHTHTRIHTHIHTYIHTSNPCMPWGACRV